MWVMWKPCHVPFKCSQTRWAAGRSETMEIELRSSLESWSMLWEGGVGLGNKLKKMHFWKWKRPVPSFTECKILRIWGKVQQRRSISQTLGLMVFVQNPGFLNMAKIFYKKNPGLGWITEVGMTWVRERCTLSCEMVKMSYSHIQSERYLSSWE